MFNSDKKDMKDFAGTGGFAPTQSGPPTAPQYPWPQVPADFYHARPEGAQMWGPPPSYDHVMQQNMPVYPAPQGAFASVPPGMPAYAPQQVPGAIYQPPFAAPPTFQPVPAGPPPGIPAFAQQPQVALFDPGARFGAQGSFSVPPPPPGYAPSAAQMAAMQGQPVQVQKPKNNFFTGGKGAGFTFW
ncbi:DAZ-associated protein 2-like [Phlebotomus argentipes]|uniref:DAZ-associated protein 2-like n=1 Tax=Phlebotomus argentipes TaxID=94469 RepID=UPI002892DBA0|nr:DAZ-associated protein 2-like [Phlebotomus argentipes]